MTQPVLRPVKGAIDFDTAFGDELRPDPADIDVLGHVNNVIYLKWAQDLAVRHWQTTAPPELQAQFFWIVLRHEIDYREAVGPEDIAERRTWLGAIDGPRFDRHVDIRRKGATRFAARCKTTWCLMDKAAGRPRRITEEILSAFGVEGK